MDYMDRQIQVLLLNKIIDLEPIEDFERKVSYVEEVLDNSLWTDLLYRVRSKYTLACD